MCVLMNVLCKPSLEAPGHVTKILQAKSGQKVDDFEPIYLGNYQSWAFEKHTVKRKRKFGNQNFSSVKRKRKFRNQKFLSSKRKRKFRNQNFLRLKRKRKFHNQNFFSLKRKRKFRNQNF